MPICRMSGSNRLFGKYTRKEAQLVYASRQKHVIRQTRPDQRTFIKDRPPQTDQQFTDKGCQAEREQRQGARWFMAELVNAERSQCPVKQIPQVKERKPIG